jgi:hypothetical protein
MSRPKAFSKRRALSPGYTKNLRGFGHRKTVGFNDFGSQEAKGVNGVTMRIEAGNEP